MWNFANSLFVALLYPGSLLLPGIFGFIVQLFVVLFGTLVGDWVDNNRRMKGSINSDSRQTNHTTFEISLLFQLSGCLC